MGLLEYIRGPPDAPSVNLVFPKPVKHWVTPSFSGRSMTPHVISNVTKHMLTPKLDEVKCPECIEGARKMAHELLRQADVAGERSESISHYETQAPICRKCGNIHDTDETTRDLLECTICNEPLGIVDVKVRLFFVIAP